MKLIFLNCISEDYLWLSWPKLNKNGLGMHTFWVSPYFLRYLSSTPFADKRHQVNYAKAANGELITRWEPNWKLFQSWTLYDTHSFFFFCFLLGIVFFAKNVKSHMIDSQPVFKPISWIVCASKVASKYQN